MANSQWCVRLALSWLLLAVASAAPRLLAPSALGNLTANYLLADDHPWLPSPEAEALRKALYAAAAEGKGFVTGIADGVEVRQRQSGSMQLRGVFATRTIKAGEVPWIMSSELFISKKMLPKALRIQIAARHGLSPSSPRTELRRRSVELASLAAVFVGRICSVKLRGSVAKLGVLDAYIATMRALPPPRNIFYFSDQDLDLLKSMNKFEETRLVASDAIAILRSTDWGAGSGTPCKFQSQGNTAFEDLAREILAQAYARMEVSSIHEQPVIVPYVDLFNHYADGGTVFALGVLHETIANLGMNGYGPEPFESRPDLQDALNPMLYTSQEAPDGKRTFARFNTLRTIEAGEELLYDYKSKSLLDGGLGSLVMYGFRSQPALLVSIAVSWLYDVPDSVAEMLRRANCMNAEEFVVHVWDVPAWPAGLYPNVFRCLESFHIASRDVQYAHAFLEANTGGSEEARAQVYKDVAKACESERKSLERVPHDALDEDSVVGSYAAGLARGPLRRCQAEAEAAIKALLKGLEL